jgi:hypothetical protein
VENLRDQATKCNTELLMQPIAPRLVARRRQNGRNRLTEDGRATKTRLLHNIGWPRALCLLFPFAVGRRIEGCGPMRRVQGPCRPAARYCSSVAKVDCGRFCRHARCLSTKASWSRLLQCAVSFGVEPGGAHQSEEWNWDFVFAEWAGAVSIVPVFARRRAQACM